MSAELPDFDQRWDYDDPAATERQFRELLPLAEQSGDRAYLAELLSQIARAEALQRNFDQAHATLDRALALLENAPSADSPRPSTSSDDAWEPERARVRYLLERGRAFNSANRPERARPLFLEAWQQGRALGDDFFAIDAAHMLAIVEPPERQLEWNLKALALAESSAQPRAKKWFGSLYNNVGWAYHGAGEYQKALDMFHKALRCREEAGDTAQIRIARWCVARALRSLGRVEEALAAQQRLLTELNALGETDGYIYEELAECLLLLGRAGEARPYFARAFAELSQDPWLAQREPERLERLRTAYT
jgi:tetratricopeptide (TPR) repeat protein